MLTSNMIIQYINGNAWPFETIIKMITSNMIIQHINGHVKASAFKTMIEMLTGNMIIQLINLFHLLELAGYLGLQQGKIIVKYGNSQVRAQSVFQKFSCWSTLRRDHKTISRADNDVFPIILIIILYLFVTLLTRHVAPLVGVNAPQVGNLWLTVCNIERSRETRRHIKKNYPKLYSSLDAVSRLVFVTAALRCSQFISRYWRANFPSQKDWAIIRMV